ncbi:sugar lactone lactonase YvrE/FlaG/FlaF family flagellin (archaellin) [Rhodanobacter sp. A1T4]|nr:sugar lactone lactonase YvrE/FlaG/FlaF family flagellin (archaellin) [Rhodanobacter sp. A1T4]
MFSRVASHVEGFVASPGRKAFSLLIATALLGACIVPQAGYCNDSNDPYATYFISSFGSNQVMSFNEDTGKFLGVIAAVSGPVASQIGFRGDLFLSASGSGQVLRFDGYSGAYKGVYIDKGNGGLISPSAPNFGPDNKVYVGDSTLNQILRYDSDGKFIDVFATHDQADGGLTQPFMQTFDQTSMYMASGGTNSVLHYDLQTKKFLGAIAPPNPSDLVQPIGLEFGPDGNLYVGSAGTNAVLRFNGKTLAFMDIFVPPGYGGIVDPHAIRFGGPNSNLYVVSTGTNQVMEYDRVTGKFLGIIADGNPDGLSEARGLTFTPRPIFNVFSHVAGSSSLSAMHDFRHVFIEHHLKDYSDPSSHAELMSIVSSDKNVDINKSVRNAHIGEADYSFDLDFSNKSGTEQYYTITYIASNNHGLTTIATTEVDVPPQR